MTLDELELLLFVHSECLTMITKEQWSNLIFVRPSRRPKICSLIVINLGAQLPLASIKFSKEEVLGTIRNHKFTELFVPANDEPRFRYAFTSNRLSGGFVSFTLAPSELDLKLTGSYSPAIR